jgi:hypothetical protein
LLVLPDFQDVGRLERGEDVGEVAVEGVDQEEGVFGGLVDKLVITGL